MVHRTVRITHRSWFSRIGGAMVAIPIGLLMMLGSVIGLFWNEGRAIYKDRALREGAGQVISIDASEPSSDDQGKLVHVSGDLRVPSPPYDLTFPTITASKDAVRLDRNIRIFQWTEKSKSERRQKLGGGEETVTTYEYQKKWVDEPIDSTRFQDPQRHTNSIGNGLANKTFHANLSLLGALQFPAASLDSIAENRPLPITDQQVEAFAASGEGKLLPDGSYYFGKNENDPAIGDRLLSYSESVISQLSGVGELHGNELKEHVASNGVKIRILSSGIKTSQEMFDQAITGNNILTWVLRLAGLLVMWVSFVMILSIVGVAGDVVPIIGNLLRFTSGLVSVALTAILGGTTIAFGWIWYRPLVGFAILACAIGLAAILIFVSKKKAASAGIEVPSASRFNGS